MLIVGNVPMTYCPWLVKMMLLSEHERSEKIAKGVEADTLCEFISI
jgi:hypothetical protein